MPTKFATTTTPTQQHERVLPWAQLMHHSQNAIQACRSHIFAYMDQNTTNCNFTFTCYYQICARNNMPTKLGINATYGKYLTCIYEGFMHIYATYELTGINYKTRNNVLIFNISLKICLPIPNIANIGILTHFCIYLFILQHSQLQLLLHMLWLNVC